VLAVQDKAGKNYRVFSSQFSPLASGRRDDFECWELEGDIVPIKELTVHADRQENYIACHFMVPSYQRGYRRDEERLETL
jgi:hypothetical protein